MENEEEESEIIKEAKKTPVISMKTRKKKYIE